MSEKKSSSFKVSTIAIISYTIFLITVIIFIFNGFSVSFLGFIKNLTFAEKWTVGGLMGSVISGIIYYMLLDFKFLTSRKLKALGLIMMLSYLAIGIATTHALSNVRVHLYEGVTLVLIITVIDYTIQRNIPNQEEKRKFKNGFLFSDIPSLVGLTAIATIYEIAPYFVSVTNGQLNDFLAGAFAFNLIAMGLTSVLVESCSN